MIKPLIYNSDIKAIMKKAEKQSLNVDEIKLIRLGRNCPETKVQWAIVTTLKALKSELEFLWGFSTNDFVIAQRENGAATKFQRIKRAREGTHPKMPDLDIFLGNGKKTKTIFIECKKIGTPSIIEGRNKEGNEHYRKQLECHEKLRRAGFSVHLTNNPVYVKNVVCEEIRKFYENEYEQN